MQTTLSRDGTSIAYETSGSGPALVVVNGGLSARASVAPFRPALDPHFMVVAYDRRGRGDSGDASQYAPERELEDLAAIIDVVGAPAFVYGHSAGAILALRAARKGAPIRQLAVYEPPLFLNGTRPLPPADIVARLDALLGNGDREGALRLFFLEDVGLPEAALTQLTASPFWPQMLRLAHTTPYDATIAGTSAFSPDEFASLSTRTLVLHGTASFPWIIETARALAGALPNAEQAELAGQSHSPQADVLAPHLVRFFQ